MLVHRCTMFHFNALLSVHTKCTRWVNGNSQSIQPAKMMLIQFHLSKVFLHDHKICQESGENTKIMHHLLNRLGEDGWSVDYTKAENIIAEVFMSSEMQLWEHSLCSDVALSYEALLPECYCRIISTIVPLWKCQGTDLASST